MDTTTRPSGQGSRAGQSDAAGSIAPSGRRRRGAIGALKRALRADLDEGRGFAFLAVAFGAGVLCYFALPSEPYPYAFPVLTLVAAGLVVKQREGRGWLIGLVALFFLAGISAGSLRVVRVDAPMLAAPLERVAVEGRLLDIESVSPGRVRLLIAPEQIGRLDPERTPARIRVTAARRLVDVAPGERVRLRASLQPPPEPVEPGSFHFGFQLFFQRIGATGFALGRVEVTGGTTLSATSAHGFVEALRRGVGERISSALAGDAGAIAIALLVGRRDLISDEAEEALRGAGLAHVLAISGLHMALIVLSVFAALRAMLALSERVALFYPARTIAAIVALAVAAFYLMLSGASIATQRAFVMVALLLIGVALGRKAINLRSVAIAAIAVLALSPESLLGPSFQMSFAAATALIASYEGISRRNIKARPQGSAAGNLVMRALSWPAGLALTSLIASLATAPFAAFHFDRFGPLAVLGNVLAMPFVGTLIMPSGLLAVLAMPFGLEALPLAMMGWGIDQVLFIAAWVSDLPYAEIPVPAIRPAALVLLTAGLLWLALWRRKQRWLGLVVLPVAALFAFQPRPDVIVARDGHTVGVLDGEGYRQISGLRRGRFDADLWLRRDGDVRDRRQTQLGADVSCDEAACLHVLPAQQGGEPAVLSHVSDISALDEDCRSAEILVTALAVPAGCTGPQIVIDGSLLERSGSIALYSDGTGGWRIEPTFSRRVRPWENPQRGSSFAQ
ncbi:MAG: ComEC family competence protein [Hyphomicrobiaceae bacterium]|nr:ComEC family competence protein [Hyphomicrobiaceae bacterium]